MQTENDKQHCISNLLQDSEAILRAMIENLPGGAAFVVDSDLRYRLAEGEALSAAGFQPEDLVGRTIFEVLPSELAASYEVQYRKALAGDRFEVEHQAYNRFYISRGTPLRSANGEVYGVLVVSYDITDRKQADRALRESEARQAFLLRMSDALRSLADPVEIEETVTRTAMNHFEAERCYYCEIKDGNAIIRRDATRDGLPTVAGVYPLSSFAILQAVVDTGRPFVVQDVHTTDTVDEEVRQLCIQLQVISYIDVPVIKNGKPVGVLCLVQSTPRNWSDLEIELAIETAERTWAAVERARAEQALRESEIQRVREQSAREQERQRAESLAELDRAKTLFFSNISHEFRTPLTLSLAPLQDVLSDRTHPLDPIHRERLELVHRNNLRLLKLVNTLLDFSRIEAGRIEAVYEPTDLATYTAELASVFRSAIERAGLQLIVDCPPLPEPVFVDRQMWEKIVLNLLSNAFKFTFEGKIRVSLHSTDSNQAILQVQDTGTGIAPEHLPHLFERFYQIRSTQARTHEGSGIGLALVHELVRLHGGTIDVSSIVGQGTCFAIALPFGTDHLQSDRIAYEQENRLNQVASTAMGATAYVAEAERWLPTIPPQPPLERGENLVKFPLIKGDLGGSSQSKTDSTSARVLLVDDNADMREYLTHILSEYVQIEAVADGATALAIAQERVPDLILSDVMMPGLDGFELLEALRADPRTREVPIILLSARAGGDAIAEGLQAGADDYLIKPFSAQELISRVTTHLQMAQLRGEALQEARSTIRSKDELISVVSHELNTPLVSILGWTRLLRSNPSSPAMLNKALDIIEHNATVQAKLVQDLLDISRISAGKLRLNLEPVELEGVIDKAIATVDNLAQAKQINLVWYGDTSKVKNVSLVVMGDRDRLGQVVCNLLTNAIKFTPISGCITVELSAIEDNNFPERSCTQITVSDTGIGIAVDFLPHVFDRFRQARESDSTKGLGLGLAIARHIVELHHGTIHAESAGVGVGATFIVRLPLYKPNE
ncbi:hypothetical protein NIES2119_11745 [[Phormidium ambiguum] IAM M-71]|uniref:histidine kinase n=1 Tax=[Phormidium ambiguum] IAM M-71 TaxID=454136 RepID=A0A1U7IKX1_9CYAN|nr:ATP-binding protein [Phormidium ambiguum]OKH37822.1 hypothetical protein NIES2119_11745 [Phormidium ambiguum IAM M-71]